MELKPFYREAMRRARNRLEPIMQQLDGSNLKEVYTAADLLKFADPVKNAVRARWSLINECLFILQKAFEYTPGYMSGAALYWQISKSYTNTFNLFPYLDSLALRSGEKVIHVVDNLTYQVAEIELEFFQAVAADPSAFDNISNGWNSYTTTVADFINEEQTALLPRINLLKQRMSAYRNGEVSLPQTSTSAHQFESILQSLLQKAERPTTTFNQKLALLNAHKHANQLFSELWVLSASVENPLPEPTILMILNITANSIKAALEGRYSSTLSEDYLSFAQTFQAASSINLRNIGNIMVALGFALTIVALACAVSSFVPALVGGVGFTGVTIGSIGFGLSLFSKPKPKEDLNQTMVEVDHALMNASLKMC